ncbi:MAG: hypothetical protein K2I00_00240 [Ruminococcus sp.]|nr:hypothetical protein [Ruminococcus sp.]
MEKWYERFKDKAFTYYWESGEAEAVHIVRDCATGVNTTGKWIDVVSERTITEHSESSAGLYWIIAELFPRIHKPEYTDDTDYNRYLTWYTAHNDICEHRSKNHHGEKFFILCELIKKKRIVHEKEREYIDRSVIDSCRVNQKNINSINKLKSAEILKNIRENGNLSLSSYLMSFFFKNGF